VSTQRRRVYWSVDSLNEADGKLRGACRRIVACGSVATIRHVDSFDIRVRDQCLNFGSFWALMEGRCPPGAYSTNLIAWVGQVSIACRPESRCDDS
jgi:hypothetical protein